MYVTRGSGSSNDRIGIPLPEQRPSDTDPSKPATKPLGGWAALDGLSDSTKTVITTTLKFGLAALVLSYVIPLAYALIIGRCPEGETYVLTRGDDSTINPNWATQWSSVMSTEVTRHCVPRTPCKAALFVFHEYRGAQLFLDLAAFRSAAAFLRSKLMESPLPLCVKASESFTPAVENTCMRSTDLEADDELQSSEWSAFFACLKVPLACQPALCA